MRNRMETMRFTERAALGCRIEITLSISANIGPVAPLSRRQKEKATVRRTDATTAPTLAIRVEIEKAKGHNGKRGSD